MCTYLPVRNVDVDSILVIQQPPHISHGGIQHPLPFIQAPLLQGAGQGAGVSQCIHLLNLSAHHNNFTNTVATCRQHCYQHCWSML